MATAGAATAGGGASAVDSAAPELSWCHSVFVGRVRLPLRGGAPQARQQDDNARRQHTTDQPHTPHSCTLHARRRTLVLLTHSNRSGAPPAPTEGRQRADKCPRDSRHEYGGDPCRVVNHRVFMKPLVKDGRRWDRLRRPRSSLSCQLSNRGWSVHRRPVGGAERDMCVITRFHARVNTAAERSGIHHRVSG